MRELWSRTLSPGLCGLLSARERGWLVTWDGGGALTVLDVGGTEVAGVRLEAPLGAVACAEDGSAFAAVAGQRLLYLGADLKVRWEQRLGGPAALALEAFGQYVAVADSSGGLRILDRLGKPTATVPTPRPLRFLAFAVERPFLLGAADFGLVA